jgi:hypothetical protein
VDDGFAGVVRAADEVGPPQRCAAEDGTHERRRGGTGHSYLAEGGAGTEPVRHQGQRTARSSPVSPFPVTEDPLLRALQLLFRQFQGEVRGTLPLERLFDESLKGFSIVGLWCL